MKRSRKISFLVTPKEFKLLVEAGILDAKIRSSIDSSRTEDKQIRITFQYEALHKLLTLVKSYTNQVSSTKKEALRNLYEKIVDLIGLFSKVGPGNKPIKNRLRS